MKEERKECDEHVKDLYEQIRISRRLIKYMKEQVESINKDIEKQEFYIRHNGELIDFMLDL